MTNFKKVSVLYVGGTIGMKRNERNVYTPVPEAFLQKVKFNSEMHDPSLAAEYNLDLRENELVLPTNTPLIQLVNVSLEEYLVVLCGLNNFKSSANIRCYGHDAVIYQIIEYNSLLDSSNITPSDWVRIAEDIKCRYDLFDGFIVLHGTDTLAYTSSALSFMLEGLRKPVIITGSQIPIFETRSDAKDNIISSLIIAGCYDIPEVCVFFANKLFRGNRVTKISSKELDAFDSPNYHTLADVGIDFKINQNYIRKIDPDVPFIVHTNLNLNVAKIATFPTLTYGMLKSFLNSSIRGLVLESYGSGNLPSDRTDLMDVLKKAVENEILIVNVTQCSKGNVSCALYETGQVADEIGIIAGEDITGEAALAKLSYVLAIPGLTYQQRVMQMRTNLRGEMTTNLLDS